MPYNFSSAEAESIKEAVNDVLDLVERPVGTFKPRLPQTPETERALVRLFDAVERNL